MDLYTDVGCTQSQYGVEPRSSVSMNISSAGRIGTEERLASGHNQIHHTVAILLHEVSGLMSPICSPLFPSFQLGDNTDTPPRTGREWK